MDSPKKRLANLFEDTQGVAIPRHEIEDLGSQLDPMKRIRRNGGARDILDAKGIALLWGKGDRKLIARLGIGPVGEDEFISYTPKDRAEWQMLADARHGKVAPPRS